MPRVVYHPGVIPQLTYLFSDYLLPGFVPKKRFRRSVEPYVNPRVVFPKVEVVVFEVEGVLHLNEERVKVTQRQKEVSD